LGVWFFEKRDNWQIRGGGVEKHNIPLINEIGDEALVFIWRLSLPNMVPREKVKKEGVEKNMKTTGKTKLRFLVSTISTPNSEKVTGKKENKKDFSFVPEKRFFTEQCGVARGGGEWGGKNKQKNL